MLKFSNFSGINNVLPTERLTPVRTPAGTITPLAVATNVDMGLDGELRRRAGYSVINESCHKNLWQAEGFMLATGDGILTAIWPDNTRVTIHPALGVERVWYCNLPDGRTAFSNGAINGITDGLTLSGWGVPVPAGVGAAMDIAGGLFPGTYQYQITYVRLSDGLEGGPQYAAPVEIADGGIFLSGLPELAGYKINVYLTSHNGGPAYFAGSTTTGVFSFVGTNEELVIPCRTEHVQPAPVGTLCAFWRGRTLVAQGSVLYASVTNQWEAFDLRRDFKQVVGDITVLVPVENGIYVGTTDSLAFLAGVEWDRLQFRRVVDGAAVLGSGVSVRGELVQQGEGGALGPAMLCIADGVVVAGFNDGDVRRITEGRYRTAVTEVAATFRQVNGIPQYIAVEQ